MLQIRLLGGRIFSPKRGGKTMQELILNLLRAKRGHFLLESGHHGDLWLDLETLCLRPRLLEPLIAELAERLATMGIDAVCGPLVEGAFAALMVASRLNIEFTYSERFSQPTPDGLFPVAYRVPIPLRDKLGGKRVAIVNDVINAGSAVKGTFADLQECGATVVAIAALLVLGTAASEFAAQVNVALIGLETLPSNLWTAQACPLCSAGVPLQNIAGFAAALPA
jgi:orotate phosphoribosyltransferase